MFIRIKYLLLVFFFIITTYNKVLPQDVMLVASETVGGSTLDFSEGDVKLIELSPTLNSSWSDTVTVDSLGQIVVHSSIISIDESIVVPSGNFTNCALVRKHFTQGTNTLMIWNNWYAENIGEVYFENSFGGSVQLLSYSIQGGNGYYPIEIGNYWEYDTGDITTHTVISKEIKEGHLCYRVEKSSQSTYWIWITEPPCHQMLLEKMNNLFDFYDEEPDEDTFIYPTTSQKPEVEDPSLLEDDDFWVVMLYPAKCAFMQDGINGEIDSNDWYRYENSQLTDELSFDLTDLFEAFPDTLSQIFKNWLSVECKGGPATASAKQLKENDCNDDTISVKVPFSISYSIGQLTATGGMKLWYDHQTEELDADIEDYIDLAGSIELDTIQLLSDTFKVKLPLINDSLKVILNIEFVPNDVTGAVKLKTPDQGSSILDYIPGSTVLSLDIDSEVNCNIIFCNISDTLSITSKFMTLLEVAISVYDFREDEEIESPLYDYDVTYSKLKKYSPLCYIHSCSELNLPFDIDLPLYLDFSYGEGSVNTDLDCSNQPSQSLAFLGKCPIDLEVVDPGGLIITKQINEIPGSIYIEADVNGDSDLDNLVFVANRKSGNYYITVIPEPDAAPTDTYDLIVGYGDTSLILAENVSVSDIPDEPYIFESIETAVSQSWDNKQQNNLLADKISLSQNYPNPFNQTTTINYELKKEGIVKLYIYDIAGHLVQILVDEFQVPGYYSKQWNTSRISSGIYFYKISFGNYKEIKKCLFLK